MHARQRVHHDHPVTRLSYDNTLKHVEICKADGQDSHLHADMLPDRATERPSLLLAASDRSAKY